MMFLCFSMCHDNVSVKLHRRVRRLYYNLIDVLSSTLRELTTRLHSELLWIFLTITWDKTKRFIKIFLIWFFHWTFIMLLPSIYPTKYYANQHLTTICVETNQSYNSNQENLLHQMHVKFSAFIKCESNVRDGINICVISLLNYLTIGRIKC